MKTLSIDIETYSDVPLPKTGVYRYCESPDFEILLFGYSVDSDPVQVVDLACGEKIPEKIIAALEDETIIKLVFNASFERVCLSKFLGYPTGEYLDPESWRCSMIWAATMGLPLSLEGYSMDRIAKGLEADGILTGAGKTKWWTSTINKILRNEKYIGDALLQKTYTTDFLNKTRVKNNGIVPQYYVEGNHEAIIPKDIFLRVQEELVRRRVVKTSANGKKRSYSCNHCFAQIVICGECGEMFRRIHWNNRGCKSIVWRCISRLEPTGQECHARTVNKTVLDNVVVQAINTLLGDKSTYQAQLQQNIAKVIRSAQQNTADGINERLQRLQKELLKKANNKEAYDEIADEIFKLREQREKCTVDTAARDAQISRINELQDFIKQQPAHLETFDEALVKRWLERIIVWEDHFTVELKSGLKIDIEG